MMLSSAAMAQYNLAKDGFIQDTVLPIANSTSGLPVQGFEDINFLPGWVIDNQSNPIGTNSWFQGTTDILSAHMGPEDSYIAANFNSTAGSDICNYLILPDLGFLQSMSFWTRTSLNSNFPDRLLLVHSPTGGINTGDCINGFGDFSTTLQEINPDLANGGYPEDWTQFSSQINDTGRLALVYYVTEGGIGGANSNYVAIDTVEWISGLPTANLQLSVTNNANGILDDGDSVTFSQSLTNNGPQDATNTRVISTIPRELDYVSNNCGATVSGSTLTWDVGTLSTGSSDFCNVEMTVSGFGRIEFVATASADELDNTNNNTASSGINGPIQVIPSLSWISLLLLMIVIYGFGLNRSKSQTNP